ncbi:glycoside hydrolase family 17 protein [Alternaria burnsii]|uniref:glucan endo-1,3-beta-D-glucosidase n=1 Tax=Alternaria burnsii TaxID=1187904 RepID=A0A8H7BEB1_9PLEO|nr:glycoside hydrolase family 17 protein [Alternaria burnsii]KAF7677793.1 glycoside hydrolase family 17 protein [Alternaria burnsii]
MRYFFCFLFSSCLAQAASKVFTGFNYGAFWSLEANVKKKADFLDGFNLARNLTTDIPFDSARLFTCKAAGTVNEPTEAFDAAVDSKTNLLLGFWITPGQKGGSLDENVKDEMAALEKGFKKHGQALSDLVIGLSIGSEDIYRAEEAGEIGVTAAVVGQTIAQVKKDIAASSFAQYMKDKPIGHVDTAKYAVVDNADFIGMTAYPYWNKDSIESASTSFQSSLEQVKQHAGNRPVWIAEMGWPSTDTESHGAAVAGVNEAQKFWSEAGCAVFGKYTTFYFELLEDTTPEQKADWSIIDTNTRQSRIRNLSCGNPQAKLPTGASAISQASSQSVGSTPPSIPVSVLPVTPSAPAVIPSSESPSTGSTQFQVAIGPKTVTVNTTSTTIVFAETTTIAAPRDVPLDVDWCITVVDMDRNSKPITIAAGPAGLDGECISPPTYQGYPYITARSAAEPSKIPIGTNWCVTVADIDRNGRPIPVDAGPAGADGECSVPPTYSGIPVITALTSDSGAPEPSKELLLMSQTMDLASPSSIQVLAGTVASSASAVTPLPTSSERSQCKRCEPRSTPLPASNSTVLVPASITTSTSLYLATSFRIPSGPFGATLSDSPTSMLSAATDVKVTVEDGHKVAIRRRGINNLFKWIRM